MKKRTIIATIFLALAGSLYFYFNHTRGWREFHGNINTPKEYLTNVIVKKKSYMLDSLEILRRLKPLLIKHEDFFSNSAYSDSTHLIIDSILYSPDLSKLAVFLITKNSTRRLLMPDKTYDWYYDATCYLGIKKNDTISLSWIGPSFTNSYHIKELSNIIRDNYFNRMPSSSVSNVPRYNLNDRRFWNSSVWNEVKKRELEQREFEEEKKKHPENVYEPK
ncbi:hypothetical protein [Pedobacter sp. B4-66]|uniref:hypothetical protein n=1 Tax=Pedobacter sp. B4-66 TaxID=2817280 RepID=UPI001BDAD9F9|nr:hypothetical protein [Pedobacter sp. B4-66]